MSGDIGLKLDRKSRRNYIMDMTSAATPIDQAEFEANSRAVAEARQAIAEGRVVDHEDVRRWLLSWGTEHELPRPKCG